jgi:hypothetical protein
VISWNWTLRPNLVNEFRAGFTIDPQTYKFPFDCRAFIRTLGLDAVGPGFPTNNLPRLAINGYTGVATDRDKYSRSSDHEWNNNTSWTVGRHNLKFGFDIRRLRLVLPLGFMPGDNYGNFFFAGVFSSDPFADFLLGIPDHSVLSFAPIPVTEGRGVHYGFFAQDAFRFNQRLTLEYGLRWEFHPAFQSITGNIGTFDPSVPKSGAVIYPTGKQSLLFTPFLTSFNACPAPAANGALCTPVLSDRQAHVPEALRFAPARVAPRFGFAFRPFANDKTVLRGGFDVYNTPGLGEFYTALDGTLQTSIESYPNVSPTNGQPIFQWPQVLTPAPAFVPAL